MSKMLNLFGSAALLIESSSSAGSSLQIPTEKKRPLSFQDVQSMFLSGLYSFFFVIAFLI